MDAPKEESPEAGEAKAPRREGEAEEGIEKLVKKAERGKEKEKEGDKYSELENQLKRLQAEFENFQKRTEKENRVRADMGKAELLRELLPVLDELEEAKKHTKDEGVKMVLGKLEGALSSAGLAEIDTEGLYDPSMHEVVGTKLSESREGTVVDVMRKGYVMGDTVIRPSMVVISKK